MLCFCSSCVSKFLLLPLLIAHSSKHHLNFAHAHTLTQVRTFVDDAYKRTVALVEAKKDLITSMANELLSKEVCITVF